MAAGHPVATLKARMRLGHELVLRVLYFFWLSNVGHSRLRQEKQSAFMQFTVELWTSPLISDRESARRLFDDWCLARSRVLTEIVAKVSYFQQLPWKLLQMAHHDAGVAADGAKSCLELWQNQDRDLAHMQTLRFLDPEYVGSPGDPPLRELVLRMAQHEDISTKDFQPLRRWLCRFRCIRLVERSVEGVHAIVTRSMKRAPAATLPYLSIELRFKSFWESIASNPMVSWTCIVIFVPCLFVFLLEACYVRYSIGLPQDSGALKSWLDSARL